MSLSSIRCGESAIHTSIRRQERILTPSCAHALRGLVGETLVTIIYEQDIPVKDDSCSTDIGFQVTAVTAVTAMGKLYCNVNETSR